MYKRVMKVIVRGEEIEVYTIGEASKHLKRSVETIRSWERKNVIPPPLYKSKSVRLYHPKEVEAMKKVLKRLGRKPKIEELQTLMWAALAQARKEILDRGEESD